MKAILLALVAVLGAEEENSPALEKFFEDFSAKRASISALKADYEEKNLLPDETFTERGRLLYVKPQRIVRHMEDQNSTILVDRRTGYLYEPEIRQLQVFSIEEDPQSDILFLGFDDDVRKLQEAYDVKLLQEDGLQGLLITPKFNPHRDPLFEELKILFEEENLLPKRIEVINDDGSKTIYTVANYQVNPSLDPSEGQLALAEGTKVIRDNEVSETVGAGGKLVPGPVSESEASEPEVTIRVKDLEPLTPEEAAAPAGTQP